MEEEEEEAWLVDSLRLYNDLHVFELQDPTRVIEWTGEKSVCVAGYGSGKRNEILQLLLPQRLYAAKGNQGLCPERDFKVELGGFSDRPVCRLKRVPQTSLLVTSGPPDGALQVWRMETEEAGVIQPLHTLPTRCPGGKCSSSSSSSSSSGVEMATSSSRAACVLHGLRTDNVQMVEVESRKTIFVAASAQSEALSGLHFLDHATILACSARGQLFLADTRQPQCELGEVTGASILSTLEGGRHSWTAGVRGGWPEAAGDQPLVARLSSGGHLLLTDLRNPARPLSAVQCCVPPASTLHGEECLSVSFAPLLEGHLAVSGFDRTVHIYNAHQWDSSTQEAKPTFVHKGHVFGGVEGAGDSPLLVTAHTWHPSKPRTLLSAASDGSLHVWDWADPQGSAA